MGIFATLVSIQHDYANQIVAFAIMAAPRHAKGDRREKHRVASYDQTSGYRRDPPSSLLALGRNSGGTGGSGLRIEVFATLLDRLEVLVELIDQRNRGRRFTLAISSSVRPSSILTIARSELPWAAMSTVLPLLSSG